MKISNSKKRELSLACERLFQKVMAARRANPELRAGDTCAKRPEGYKEDDKLLGATFDGWLDLIGHENMELDRILVELVKNAPGRDTAQFAKLDPSKVWVWGGPTPHWGGSMADDTLVRGADYFNARNVVYVYGPTTPKMLRLHRKYDKMLCHINGNCRSPGALATDDRTNSELLSKLSLDFPNVVGGMCDDVTVTYEHVVLPEAFEERCTALKKYNDKLKMYGVIYTHELERKDFSRIVPYMDVVNLWFWNKEFILEFDEKIALCRKVFKNKPIILGVFLHDYGRADAGAPPELLAYQLDRVREYVAKGSVEGIIILGDREIKKWPETADAVRNYLMNQS